MFLDLQMKVPLVRIPLLNTHSEPIFQIDPADLHKQVKLFHYISIVQADKLFSELIYISFRVI